MFKECLWARTTVQRQVLLSCIQLVTRAIFGSRTSKSLNTPYWHGEKNRTWKIKRKLKYALLNPMFNLQINTRVLKCMKQEYNLQINPIMVSSSKSLLSTATKCTNSKIIIQYQVNWSHKLTKIKPKTQKWCVKVVFGRVPHSKYLGKAKIKKQKLGVIQGCFIRNFSSL